MGASGLARTQRRGNTRRLNIAWCTSMTSGWCAPTVPSVSPECFKNISRNPGFFRTNVSNRPDFILCYNTFRRLAARQAAGSPVPGMNEGDVIQLLRREVSKAGSGAAWARKHGFSRAYISDLLTGKSGRSEIGARLLDALGLEVVYRRKKRPSPQSKEVVSNCGRRIRSPGRYELLLPVSAEPRAWVWTG